MLEFPHFLDVFFEYFGDLNLLLVFLGLHLLLRLGQLLPLASDSGGKVGVGEFNFGEVIAFVDGCGVVLVEIEIGVDGVVFVELADSVLNEVVLGDGLLLDEFEGIGVVADDLEEVLELEPVELGLEGLDLCGVGATELEGEDEFVAEEVSLVEDADALGIGG